MTSANLMPVHWSPRATLTANTPRTRALMTTRQGGVSTGAFAAFNLSLNVGDSPAAVAHNRALLHAMIVAQHALAPAASTSASAPTLSQPCWLSQVHGTTVLDLDDDAAFAQTQRHASSPEQPEHAPPAADAAVTTTPGRVAVVMVADCLPVLFDCGDAVGLAHAGWRGLAAGVLERTIAALRGKSALPPSYWRAWLGPCISVAAFEVGTQVRDAFTAHDPKAAACFHALPTPEKFMADLPALATQRLRHAGLRHIALSGACTFSDAARFFSHRRDHGSSGRQAACIWLVSEAA